MNGSEVTTNWNENIKVSVIDRFLKKTLLGLLPKRITPNQITLFRFLSIPFIAYFFLTHSFVYGNLYGTILFMFSALSDALDGALARTTKQITDWGIVNDPFADKLLIGVVSIIVIAKYWSLSVAMVIVFLELCLVTLNYWRHKGKIVPARMSGKIKMFLQCVGVIFLLLFVLTEWPLFFIFAQICLFAAIIFALVSLFLYYSI